MESKLYYLAVPYHGSEEEKKYRTEISLKAAAEFLRQGIHLFAPVIYVNKIAEELELTSLKKRRKMVMPYLLDFLKVSKGLILIDVAGWQDSWGIQQELKFCCETQVPVYKVNPEMIYGNLPQLLSAPLNQKQVAELMKTR